MLKKKGKRAAAILLALCLLAVAVAGGLFHALGAETSVVTAWPQSTGNYIVIRVKSGNTEIGATRIYARNNANADTYSEFIDRERTIFFSLEQDKAGSVPGTTTPVTEKANGKIKLLTKSATTYIDKDDKSATNAHHSIVNLQLVMPLPADGHHVAMDDWDDTIVKSNVAADGRFQSGIGRYDLDHKTSVTLNLEVNLVNFGMFVTAGGNANRKHGEMVINLQRKNYTVTYNTQGGSGSPATATVACGNETTLPSPGKKAGNVFQGWYTAGTGGSRAGGDGDKYKVCNKDITLYAQWEERYTVTFDSQGGSVDPPAETVTKGGSVTLPKPGEKEHCLFVGWFTKPAAKKPIAYSEIISSDKVGTSASAYTPTSDVTLYAQWADEEGSIWFNANGGKGTMEKMNVFCWYENELPACAFTRTGYEFAGWAENMEGDAVYKNRAKIVLGKKSVITLYAKWRRSGASFNMQNLQEDADMFEGCESIKGSGGTVYDPQRTDSRFAHIDGGESDPGYFTKK